MYWQSWAAPRPSAAFSMSSVIDLCAQTCVERLLTIHRCDDGPGSPNHVRAMVATKSLYPRYTGPGVATVRYCVVLVTE